MTFRRKVITLYALADGFGLDRLTVVDWPEEPLPHGHVRVAVEAVSLNRRDLLSR